MAKVVNLRQARKRKVREAAAQAAARNRVVFGRTKAEKQRVAAEQERAAKRLDQHRLTAEDSDPESA